MRWTKKVRIFYVVTCSTDHMDPGFLPPPLNSGFIPPQCVKRREYRLNWTPLFLAIPVVFTSTPRRRRRRRDRVSERKNLIIMRYIRTGRVRPAQARIQRRFPEKKKERRKKERKNKKRSGVFDDDRKTCDRRSRPFRHFNRNIFCCRFRHVRS